jgi:hypothetical protein
MSFKLNKKMDNFDLKKYIIEGRIHEDEDEEGFWFNDIITKGKEFIFNKYPEYKEYELSGMGPGDGETYVNLSLEDIEEVQFKVFFNENEDVTEVEITNIV